MKKFLGGKKKEKLLEISVEKKSVLSITGHFCVKTSV